MLSETQTQKDLHQILSQYCTPSDALVEDFKKSARLINVKKGEAVVRQGEICNVFVLNRKGLFRVSHINGDTEDTLLFGTSGDVFTSLHSYYAGEPAVFTLSAIEDSEAWLISYDDMRRMLEEHLSLMKWMNSLMVEQIYGFEKRYLFFTNKSVEDRFLNFMSIHSESLRRTPVKYISRIVPLKYIAQYLKITQSTLSRVRRRLITRESR
ncbi:MAG: Crp/Fnr family transcriptional regulator [Muribaculaceae bacterium]|nr:Crp/Fnr family transcriptional regulator [Muribaculaceae bacterium]